ncbi:MAG: sensor histidine kinase, partial [Gammaproteobacteria bacterium]|nr:sensor histidine kinase [Gammaproteobacteria bacterium]
DLHDGPAQLIGYSVLRLDRISKDERSKDLSEEFHVVKEALDGALKEIRDISSGLVLPELEQMSLLQALQKVVSRNAANADTVVSEYYKDLPEQIPLPIKICVYRFVQEGLNNANRHGKAEKCRVTAYVKDDMLHLSLKDNGVGFRKSTLSTEGGHLGLMGLKDRIESLGGTFSINSKLGVGTAIKASLALSDEV